MKIKLQTSPKPKLRKLFRYVQRFFLINYQSKKQDVSWILGFLELVWKSESMIYQVLFAVEIWNLKHLLQPFILKNVANQRKFVVQSPRSKILNRKLILIFFWISSPHLYLKFAANRTRGNANLVFFKLISNTPKITIVSRKVLHFWSEVFSILLIS